MICLFIVFNSTTYNGQFVKNIQDNVEYKARCRDKADLKNGKLKSTIGHTYEEGTELQFDCKVLNFNEINIYIQAGITYDRFTITNVHT